MQFGERLLASMGRPSEVQRVDCTHLSLLAASSLPPLAEGGDEGAAKLGYTLRVGNADGAVRGQLIIRSDRLERSSELATILAHAVARCNSPLGAGAAAETTGEFNAAFQHALARCAHVLFEREALPGGDSAGPAAMIAAPSSAATMLPVVAEGSDADQWSGEPLSQRMQRYGLLLKHPHLKKAVELGPRAGVATGSSENDNVYAFSSDDEETDANTKPPAATEEEVAMFLEADADHRRALQERIDELESTNLAALRKVREAEEEAEWYDEALQDEDEEEEKAELERKAEEARTKLTAAKLEAGNVTAKITALRAHMDDKTSAAAAASTAVRKNSLGMQGKLQAHTHVVGAAQKAGKTRREVNAMKSEEQKAEMALKASQDEERRQHLARLHNRLSTRRGLTESEQKRAHDAALESARSQRAEEEAAERTLEQGLETERREHQRRLEQRLQRRHNDTDTGSRKPEV